MKLCLLFLLSACSAKDASQVNDNLQKHYMHTLKMTIDNQIGYGTLIINKSNKYKITVNADATIEVLRLSTCHREIVKEKSGWLGKSEITFDFLPTRFEQEGFCPIHIAAFDIDGEHSFGIVEIRNELSKSSVECNGKFMQTSGVTLCQARAGTLQRITFDYPMRYSITDCVDMLASSDSKSFVLTVKPGLCTIPFVDNKGLFFHRLTVYGFNDILLKTISKGNQ